MEEIILKYVLQAGAIGLWVYLIYSERQNTKELYVPLKESIDKLTQGVTTLLTKLDERSRNEN